MLQWNTRLLVVLVLALLAVVALGFAGWDEIQFGW